MTLISRGIGGHQSAKSQTDTWLTPPHIIAALGGLDSFDLDPCAFAGWITAKRGFYLPKDGLAEDWYGRVWLNPPYGQETFEWLAKLADHGNGVALIFARTETAGFVEQVWGRADALLFLHGRLHFHQPDGTRAKANSGAPSVLVAYGQANAHQLRKCGLPGTVVAGWRVWQSLDDDEPECTCDQMAHPCELHDCRGGDPDTRSYAQRERDGEKGWIR